jgi:peptidoglycan/xylan/chitin deacetylase (PgdA/CDA1 family)
MRLSGPVLALLTVLASSASAQPRAVAITIDDLPFGGGPQSLRCDDGGLRELNGRILAALRDTGAPAVGFVNEGRACSAETLQDVLMAWLDAGHELGNHTATHPDLTRVPLTQYQADVVRGETMLRRLLGARGQNLTYFRHPFLRTGDTEGKRAALATFLAGRGYTVAPVTIDSDEWVFAGAYGKAIGEGDHAMAGRVLDAYVPWFESVVAHYEGWSIDVLGREPAQVLLLHANLLNAQALPELLEMFRRRGYGFVSLGEALRDPACGRPDRFVGRYGSSWLHRWARADGLDVRWEPDAPGWVSSYLEGSPN